MLAIAARNMTRCECSAEMPVRFITSQTILGAVVLSVAWSADGKRALSLKESTSAQNFQLPREGIYEVRRANGRHELIAVHAPEEAAVEEVFVNVNPQPRSPSRLTESQHLPMESQVRGGGTRWKIRLK